MSKKSTIFISLLLALIFITSSFSAASAISKDELTAKFNSTAEHLISLPTPQVGSIGGDWVVLGLARADLLSESEKNAYYENVEKYIKSVGSERLHQRKSTDNSRVIIALSAIGKDPTNVCGYDLTAPLSDINYVKKQGINGVFWALTALDCCNFGSVETRDKLISEILSAQHSDGGWGLDENISDPDMTAMALTALSQYRFFDADVRSATERGVALLASLQRESGGYYSYDDFNPESCAQVIVALASLGINFENDPRFCKSGVSLLDSLMRFSVDGGFEHTIGNGYNQMSTEQAFYALTAYCRFIEDKTALYDMTDIQNFAFYDIDGDGIESINDATYLQRYLAEFDVQLSVSQKRLSDLNRNGRVDVGDVTCYQRMLAS